MLITNKIKLFGFTVLINLHFFEYKVESKITQTICSWTKLYVDLDFDE